MLPVPFCDILEIKETSFEETGISFSGFTIDGDTTSNLCIRAYRIFSSLYNIPSVKIHLHKQIPPGAGLGGGSADAAFTLLMLNKLFEKGLDNETIMGMALEAGSDCPFFVKNRPVYAIGRGEEMTPAYLDLKGYVIIIVKPSFSISTALAYKHVTPLKGRVSLKDLIKEPLTKWHENIVNDFESFVLSNYQEAIMLKNELYNNGAFFAQMTGSGSAFYGLFDRMPELSQFLNDRLIYRGVLS